MTLWKAWLDILKNVLEFKFAWCLLMIRLRFCIFSKCACACACVCLCVCMLSHVLLFATLWIVACQVPLSMEFSVRILEWAAISSSRGSFWPRDRTHVSCISYIGRQILYHWTTWEAHFWQEHHKNAMPFPVYPSRRHMMSVVLLHSDHLFAVMSINQVSPCKVTIFPFA